MSIIKKLKIKEPEMQPWITVLVISEASESFLFSEISRYPDERMELQNIFKSELKP